jgi:MPBQ/MSBQ methyltransferase
MTVLPPYFDGLIAARRAGAVGRDVHLGYWDDPPALNVPPVQREFDHAQMRLSERIVDRVPLCPGQAILDVACGFGGTLAAFDRRNDGIALTGLNIDGRQLALCRDAVSRTGNSLSLVRADACALPFPPASFDHAVCVEAMFHFSSRQAFLAEAARVLRPGGLLAITDILFRQPDGVDPATIAAIIRREYGPWPELWIEPRAIQNAALDLLEYQDWSAATLPSYRTISPDGSAPLNAGAMFRLLHAGGWLTYAMFLFRRR